MSYPTTPMSHSPPSPDSPTSDLPYLSSPKSPPPLPSSPYQADPVISPFSPSMSQPTTARPQKQDVSSIGSSSSNGGTAKHRPRPLDLKAPANDGKGTPSSSQSAQFDTKDPLTSSDSVGSSMSETFDELSRLRRDVLKNLEKRPVAISSRSSASSDTTNSAPAVTIHPPKSDDNAIELSEFLSIQSDQRRYLILDTRPLGDFLEAYFPGSANISIPTLMLKRFKARSGDKCTTWDALSAFISTPEGKGIWDKLNPCQPLDVIVIGRDGSDNLPFTVQNVLEPLLEQGRARVLVGGWNAVLSSPQARSQLVVTAEWTESEVEGGEALPPPPKSAPAFDFPPPPIPPSVPLRVSHHPSMPSLRSEGSSAPFRVNAPGAISTRRTPKLSLRLDQPLRSATLPSEGSNFLTATSSSFASGRKSPGLSISVPKSPGFLSVQALCHEQSKRPPSPSTFGAVPPPPLANNDDTTESLLSPPSPYSASHTARPGMRDLGSATSSGSSSGWPTNSSNSSDQSSSMNLTARNVISPFVVTTILPSFLYLGPEIASMRDIEELRRLGVKRVLNVAIECEDEHSLGLREKFERYLKVPMRDIVEETGVARNLREACNFLDDARLHSSPTYVHCKAGKSRSVTVVLAYLIHANAWTLKTSYAYVAERRKGISPNIGFVAELMQFEESELGIRQSGGVHGEAARAGGAAGPSRGEEKDDSPRDRKMRESLPPAWASSLDSSRLPSPLVDVEKDKLEKEQEEKRKIGEEREVRKNGQWVHQRRAPVDRTTLQPGRRVSKAGLESLRPLASVNPSTSPRTSPGLSPSPGGKEGNHAVTPGGEGRLNWV
ncbi:hypothetical protein TREMEDRAFT_62249 [Tremella mesenterica DSM 1558]|uniref:uncharacterized protein n=1 Tax=Tremella mesenterica (strain ATCC 24925 / CBS 8224 / DSM 1558 / NBRC 9311 / NRRL Y-6157 / RJB 2259-6 / UBC 559-6) TaxID=578456 RepID=UPI0003F4A2FE|nr:uncharacterized protein TREMEDRAFT_62249 [Tremella mesenterica DSM 1558]EIW69382.1 hypothetical protein TREMEDRAFT_62249 [Tremella mesenterica DSM 1558]